MGMYTQLVLNVTLKEKTPEAVIATLRRIFEGSDSAWEPPEGLRTHPLFDTERWYWMMKAGGSHYFMGTHGHCEMKKSEHRGWGLMVYTDIKNYGNEWEHFCDFIAPHVEYSDMAGYLRYEESIAPTLIYFIEGKAIWVDVAPFVVPLVDPLLEQEARNERLAQ